MLPQQLLSLPAIYPDLMTEETNTSPTPETIPAPAEQPAVIEPARISFDDFAKVEVKIGTVRVAEVVPEADKLLRLEVDLVKRPDLGRLCRVFAHM